jgi:hypothetical protein
VGHPPDYTKMVINELKTATKGLKANSKAYKAAVQATLVILRKRLEKNPDLVKPKKK